MLDRTVALYRSAVDFFIDVMLRNWQQFDGLKQTEFVKLTEVLCIKTAKRPVVAYDFSADFYKIPFIPSSSSDRCGFRRCFFLQNPSGSMGSDSPRQGAGSAEVGAAVSAFI